MSWPHQVLLQHLKCCGNTLLYTCNFGRLHIFQENWLEINSLKPDAAPGGESSLCVFSIRACMYQFLNRHTVLLLCPRAVSHFKNLIRPCLTPLTCVWRRWGCDGAVPGWRWLCWLMRGWEEPLSWPSLGTCSNVVTLIHCAHTPSINNISQNLVKTHN